MDEKGLSSHRDLSKSVGCVELMETEMVTLA